MLPPGPRAPAFVQFLRSSLRPAAFLHDCARRYGDVFTMRVPGEPPHVFFSHPDAIRDVFTADPDDLRAGESNGLLEPVVGPHSLLLLDGARHRRERRLMLPPFHGERMQAYGRLIRDLTDRAIDAWPVGRPFPVHESMRQVTLEVILHAVFGVDDDVAPVLRERLARLMRFIGGPAAVLLLLSWFRRDLGPHSPGRTFTRLMTAVDEAVYAAIARRRAAGATGRDDILSMLLEARYDDGSGMSDAELRDEMMTLLVAGHETTATSLAWLFHHLLARPDVLARLREELHRVVGDDDVDSHHLPRLEYLDAAVKEAARTSPVIAFVGRLAHRPVRIGGHDLPAGVIVVPCMYLAHHRPDVWPEPARFDPDRFLGLRPSPYRFFPFGGGVRRCLGAAFATFETKLVLARVLARVAMRAAPGARVRLVRRNITFAPSAGMPVVVERRDVRSPMAGGTSRRGDSAPPRAPELPFGVDNRTGRGHLVGASPPANPEGCSRPAPHARF
jgi:cytochrome P450